MTMSALRTMQNASCLSVLTHKNELLTLRAAKKSEDKRWSSVFVKWWKIKCWAYSEEYIVFENKTGKKRKAFTIVSPKKACLIPLFPKRLPSKCKTSLIQLVLIYWTQMKEAATRERNRDALHYTRLIFFASRSSTEKYLVFMFSSPWECSWYGKSSNWTCVSYQPPALWSSSENIAMKIIAHLSACASVLLPLLPSPYFFFF